MYECCTTAIHERLCSAFVDYFPRALGLIFHPVLTFSHLVREVIARVFLIEIYHCQVFSSRIEKHSNIADSDLDPVFGGVDLALVLRPFSQSLISAGKIASVVPQVSFDVPAFPIPSPIFKVLCQLFTHDLRIRWLHPFDPVADDNGRDPNLQFGAKPVQVLIRQHDAAVTGAGRAAEGVRGGAVEPDTIAATAVPFIPFVGIVDGKCLPTIKIGQLFARNISRNEVNADGGFFYLLPLISGTRFSRY